MAKTTKAAAPVKKQPAAHTVTLDELIESAKSNMGFQMKQPHFKGLKREHHVDAAVSSIMTSVQLGHVDTQSVDIKYLEDYITEALEEDGE